MDFDAKDNILFTGDEMGFMQKWDLTNLLKKLEEVSRREQKASYKADFQFEDNTMVAGGVQPKKNFSEAASTFVTGLDAGGGPAKARLEFLDTDVKLVLRWNAHTDCINWITYVVETESVASCSFDCNVYIWNTDCQKIGSLVLGTDKLWKIKIDKSKRNDEERKEAEEMLSDVGYIDYDKMFMK